MTCLQPGLGCCASIALAAADAQQANPSAGRPLDNANLFERSDGPIESGWRHVQIGCNRGEGCLFRQRSVGIGEFLKPGSYALGQRRDGAQLEKPPRAHQGARKMDGKCFGERRIFCERLQDVSSRQKADDGRGSRPRIAVASVREDRRLRERLTTPSDVDSHRSSRFGPADEVNLTVAKKRQSRWIVSLAEEGLARFQFDQPHETRTAGLFEAIKES